MFSRMLSVSNSLVQFGAGLIEGTTPFA